MSKPIEEMMAILWEAMLRQIETRIEERIETAFANIKTNSAAQASKPPEPVHQDRPAEYFISLKEVSAMVGLSRSTIYNLEKAGTFPKKIRIGQNVVRYRVGEIREWMQSLQKAGRTNIGKEPEVLSNRQQQRLMQLALKRVPRPPPKARPYYTMSDVMRLAGFTHSQIYDGVREGNFPKWKKAGWPAQQWERQAVDLWLETQKRKEKT
jgi:predicted DNA-binding transcriptional regulator AlpA